MSVLDWNTHSAAIPSGSSPTASTHSMPAPRRMARFMHGGVLQVLLAPPPPPPIDVSFDFPQPRCIAHPGGTVTGTAERIMDAAGSGDGREGPYGHSGDQTDRGQLDRRSATSRRSAQERRRLA